jgi:hypothetical protein
MSQGTERVLELAISPLARMALANLRQRHAVTDAQLADALLEWFAELDPDQQREIIESQTIRQRCAELPKLQPFPGGGPDLRADAHFRPHSSASE